MEKEARVRTDERERLKQFAIDHFENEFREAKKLFAIKSPETWDKSYFKTITFMDNAKKVSLTKLKFLAQMIAGYVDAETNVAQEERDQTQEMLDRVDQALHVKGDFKRGGRKASPIDMRPYEGDDDGIALDDRDDSDKA